MAKQKLILSTGNPDKVKELEAIIDSDQYEVVTKKELNLGSFDVEESGTTLEENAKLKVLELAKAVKEKGLNPSDYWILGDDTGLFVDALDGRPGIYSARYAGEHATYDDNVSKLLEELIDVPDDKRNAHFETVIAVLKDGEISCMSGRLEGYIIHERRGHEGFGYDPIFCLKNSEKTLAEISENEKNLISHRARAYQKLKERMLV